MLLKYKAWCISPLGMEHCKVFNLIHSHICLERTVNESYQICPVQLKLTKK